MLSIFASSTGNFGFSCNPTGKESRYILDSLIIHNVSRYLVKVAGEAWFLMEEKMEVVSYETP